ncbi:MAG: hypothetical protein WCG25_04555 [bacterium]
MLSVSQCSGSSIHLLIAVVLLAFSSANLTAVSKVAFVILDIVLPNTGTYSVTAVSQFCKRTAHFKTFALSAVIFH